MQHVHLGYDADSVLIVDLQMRGMHLDSAQNVALLRRLFGEVQNIPGVSHASRQVTMPFWSSWNTDLHVAGIDSVDRLGEFQLNAVSGDYFATSRPWARACCTAGASATRTWPARRARWS